MAVVAEKVTTLESIYAHPTIEDMVALKPKVFEKFVALVFGHAGYRVRDVAFKFRKGLDLELYESPLTGGRRIGGIEVKKFDPTKPVGLNAVMKLLGAPGLKKALSPGYLVTTSDFTSPAKAVARESRRIHLVNGNQLVRFIRYMQGSVDDRPEAVRSAISPRALAIADDVVRERETHGTKILAVTNNKGGVGKTTTARYLALGLAAKGHRVLLVDMDAQANLSEFLLGSQAQQLTGPSLADYFAGKSTLRHAMRSLTDRPGLWLISAHPMLGRSDTGGAGQPDIEVKFVADLYEALAKPPQGSQSVFDWVILDTPPAISLFTRTALAAADYVLAPARARESSLSGVDNMFVALDAMSALMGRSPTVLGCVITHWGEDATSQSAHGRIEALFNARGSRMLDTRIPMAVAIETTPHLAANAMHAYDNLVEEVVRHVGNN